MKMETPSTIKTNFASPLFFICVLRSGLVLIQLYVISISTLELVNTETQVDILVETFPATPVLCRVHSRRDCLVKVAMPSCIKDRRSPPLGE